MRGDGLEEVACEEDGEISKGWGNGDVSDDVPGGDYWDACVLFCCATFEIGWLGCGESTYSSPTGGADGHAQKGLVIGWQERD